jgi:hypothetical protein
MGVSVGPVVLNTRRTGRNSRRGQSPETAACRAGSSLRRREQRQVQTVGGSFSAETLEYPMGGQAPKGESQERCRCETKPARNRRAKAARRVTKP